MRTALLVYAAAGSVSSADSPIKHVVVLMEENRAFDHFFGFYNTDGRAAKVNGLKGTEFNRIDASDPLSRYTYCSI